MQIIRVKLLTCIFIIVLFDTFAQSTDWIKLEAAAITLSARGQRTTVLVPLVVDPGVPFADVQVNEKPALVRYEGNYDVDFVNAFSVSKSTAPGIAVLITVNLKTIQQTGTYHGAFTFQYQPATGDMKSRQVNFSIVKPTAKLESSTAIKLTISGGELTCASPFSIREVNGQSSVRGMKLISPDITGTAKPGIIIFDPDTVTIPASCKKQIPYKLGTAASELPLGKLTGSMHLTSPEFVGPLVVSWEILNRRSRWLIIVLILSGAFLGTIVRNVLVPGKALFESRIKAAHQLQIVYSFIDNIKDNNWKGKFLLCSKRLSDALVDRSVSAMEQREKLDMAVKTVKDEFIVLEKEYTDFVKGVRERLLKLAALFETRVKIGEVEFVSAKDAYEKAKSSYESQHYTSCEEQCGRSERFLRGFGKQRALVIKQINDLMSADILVPHFISGPEKKAFTDFLANIKSQPSAPAGESIEQIVQFVLDAEAYEANLSRFATNLILTVEEKVGKEPSAAVAEAFSIWKSMVTQYLSDTLPDPIVLIALARAKAKLEAVWTPPAANELESHRAGGQSKADDDELSPAGPSMAAARILAEPSIGEPGRINTIQVANENRWAWLKSTILHFVIVCLLMSAAAYGVHYDSFIGTVPEMISIFIFAFGLDVTLDSLKTLSAKT